MLRWALMVVMIGVLVGCGAQPTEELPTVVPLDSSPTVEGELTPVDVAPVGDASATPLRRPTLPPPMATETPTPTATTTSTATPAPSATPVFVFATPNPDCVAFDVVYEQSTVSFEIGASPRAVWTPINGAQLYRLALRMSNGFVVNENIYVAETTYSFPPDLFVEGQTYGWDVYPINSAGDQMCFAVGAELIPRRSRLPAGGGG